MDPRKIAAPTPRAKKTCFFTLVIGAQQERNARLLVDSLRAFGGQMSGCPVWVFYPDLATASKETWQNVEHVHLLSWETYTRPATGSRSRSTWVRGQRNKPGRRSRRWSG